MVLTASTVTSFSFSHKVLFHLYWGTAKQQQEIQSSLLKGVLYFKQ